ncbi:hypothetical protein [Saccharopolyspora phatthalungensis]|nr:hypothetical protein [Saccharopolyspora phatthalungensis]
MRDETRHDHLVEELRMLLDAVAGKAEEYLRGCGQDAEADNSGSTCGWCPLCAAVALLRGHRPELNEQLIGIVQALRQALADQRAAAPGAADDSEEDGQEEPAASKVQRIRVHRVDGPVLAEGESETEVVSGC